MSQETQNSKTTPGNQIDHSDKYYKNLMKHTLIRLLLLYMAPFLLLIGFFNIQYKNLLTESRKVHLRSIAEHQSRTLDLFLRERVVNLSNIIDNPKLPIPPSDSETAGYLESLRKTSDAFVELGFFDESGTLMAYEGPYPELELRSYQFEDWFTTLKQDDVNHVITDVYLGFRGSPHFTIAVSRWLNGHYVVLRAVISPEKIKETIISLGDSKDVNSSIVNEEGQYQVVIKEYGAPLEKSPLLPPLEPKLGTVIQEIDGQKRVYAYSWLNTAHWALLVQDADFSRDTGLFAGIHGGIIVFTIAFFFLEFIIILFRARTTVRRQRETDATEAELSGQLVQASKLASVGELAAGIAHEINNPLAIIAEEAGLLKDLMNPEFSEGISPDEIKPHLDDIQDAAFRCRNITRKLLGFVRHTEVRLDRYNINEIVDNVMNVYLGTELEMSNIKVIKDYSPYLPSIITDRNQLEQVFLNLMKNACDAMKGEGTLTIHLSHAEDKISISISDNGCGMTFDQLDKIFMPFYTTKQVGKGTGLGLSVSYGIIKKLGGQIYVDSEPGKGSMFRVELPVEIPE